MSKRATPTRKTPASFSGTWRIIETEVWGPDALDTVQPALIRFDDEMIGSIAMIVIQAGLDCRFGERDGKPLVELTFEGDDDGHPCTGRAWAAIDRCQQRERVLPPGSSYRRRRWSRSDVEPLQARA
jgi:hypothetical protein